MDIEDIDIILTQSIGLKTRRIDDFIVTTWKINEDLTKDFIIFVDERLGLLYISVRFKDPMLNMDNLEELLFQNYKLAQVKYCLDQKGNIIINLETPLSGDLEQDLRVGIYRVFKACERLIELVDNPGE